MDVIDALIRALLLLLVPQLPGRPQPRLPVLDPPMVDPKPVAPEPAPEPIKPIPANNPEPPPATSTVDDMAPTSFRDQLKATIRNTVVELQKGREAAYRAALAETGGTVKGRHYRDDDALTQWWNTELGKLLVLLDETDLGQAVVAARAQSLIERETITQLGRAHAEGVSAEAKRLGRVRIVIPERDACLRCTSYAGAIAEANEAFQVVRDFTDPELGEIDPEGVELPVHPRCRCASRVVTRADAETLAAPLRREAERAVLRFESLPSESDRERTEAARRLLDAGTALPKTVLERADRAVRRRTKESGPPRPARK